jgi:hypothetical protein
MTRLWSIRALVHAACLAVSASDGLLVEGTVWRAFVASRVDVWRKRGSTAHGEHSAFGARTCVSSRRCSALADTPAPALPSASDVPGRQQEHPRNPEGRWPMFIYEELAARDKCSLDVFWLKDESLEDSAKLPEPHVLAEEIADDLRSALEQIESVLGDLQARAAVVGRNK